MCASDVTLCAAVEVAKGEPDNLEEALRILRDDAIGGGRVQQSPYAYVYCCTHTFSCPCSCFCVAFCSFVIFVCVCVCDSCHPSWRSSTGQSNRFWSSFWRARTPIAREGPVRRRLDWVAMRALHPATTAMDSVQLVREFRRRSIVVGVVCFICVFWCWLAYVHRFSTLCVNSRGPLGAGGDGAARHEQQSYAGLHGFAVQQRPRALGDHIARR